MVKNFRFQEAGKIALSGAPEAPEEIDWLHERGIRAVVSLQPVSSEVQERMAARGIQWHPCLFSDFAQGVPEGFKEALEYVGRRADEAPAVLIHCSGGGGRAGTTYAAYLISRGCSVEEATGRVPGVERDVQRAFLNGFAAGLAERQNRP